MSNLKGRSWLAWLLVPLVVYGAQLAFWANRMETEVWPNEWNIWRAYLFACIVLLSAMVLCIYMGLVDGGKLAIWIAAPILMGGIAYLINIYVSWDFISLKIHELKFIGGVSYLVPMLYILVHSFSLTDD